MDDLSYPEKHNLWRGVILHSIINATMVAKSAGFANGFSWDGTNFVLQKGDGTNGAVVFAEDCVVGVFFDPDSHFSPYKAKKETDLDVFFKGASPLKREFAHSHPLRYNWQKINNILKPVITAAFWDSGDKLISSFPWKEVLQNGAHLIENELKDIPQAMAAWSEAYEMNKDQITFAHRLFQQKNTDPKATIHLTRSDVDWLKKTASSTESYEDCKVAFSAMGIIAN
jgi:hypothetical protein